MFMEPQYARACDVLIGGGSRFVERISFWKFAGDEEGRGVGDAALANLNSWRLLLQSRLPVSNGRKSI